MPVDPVTGQLRQFNSSEIDAMHLESMEVRRGDNPTESREIALTKMTRVWKCDWASRYDACALLTGDEVLWSDSGVTRLSRMLPEDSYGRHPDYPEIVCTKIVSVTGWGRVEGVDSNEFPIYPKARIEAYYEHVPYPLEVDSVAYADGEITRYVWYTDGDGYAESISVPGGAMKFWRDPAGPTPTAPPNGYPVPYGVNITRGVEPFQYTHERLPYEAFTVGSPIFERVYGTVEGDPSYMGMVNSAVFLGRAIGTVLYEGCKPTLLRAHTGTGYRWRLLHKFLGAPTGHTWLWYPDPTGANAGWFMVSNTGFATADHLGDEASIVPGARDLADLFKVS